MRPHSTIFFSALVIGLASCANDQASVGNPIVVTGSISVIRSPEGCLATVEGTRLTLTPEAGAHCRVPVSVSVDGRCRGSSGGSGAELELVYDEHGLHPRDYGAGEWAAAGGGERPAFRRESPTELTIYYPLTVGNQRTWGKYTVVVK